MFERLLVSRSDFKHERKHPSAKDRLAKCEIRWEKTYMPFKCIKSGDSGSLNDVKVTMNKKVHK